MMLEIYASEGMIRQYRGLKINHILTVDAEDVDCISTHLRTALEMAGFTECGCLAWVAEDREKCPECGESLNL